MKDYFLRDGEQQNSSISKHNLDQTISIQLPFRNMRLKSINKESLGNSLYDLVFKGRGDSIRTCDLGPLIK